MNAAHISPFQSIIGQIIGHKDTPEQVDERRFVRAESILVEMLDGNRSMKELAEKMGSSRGTIADSVKLLLDSGHAYTWTTTHNSRPRRWYGLTDKGVSRAKMLREMQ